MLEVPCCGGGGDCGIPDFFDGRSPNIGHFFFLFAPHFDVAFVHPSSSSLPELDGSSGTKWFGPHPFLLRLDVWLHITFAAPSWTEFSGLRVMCRRALLVPAFCTSG